MNFSNKKILFMCDSITALGGGVVVGSDMGRDFHVGCGLVLRKFREAEIDFYSSKN